MNATIGVVAIAKNESRDIEAFLRNVGAWADEIVIVDDGSTDDTRDLIRQSSFAVTLIERALEPLGGFAAQRNAGTEAAVSDWILHMDIDERVTPAFVAELRAATQDPELGACRYRRLNYFLHRPFAAGGWETWNEIQFCRRKYRFNGEIHEKIRVEDSKVNQLSTPIIHLNDEDYNERLRKNVQYSYMSGVEIARGRQVGSVDMLVQPAIAAVKAYVLRGAWRYGTRGLIFGILTFAGVFNRWATAWDLQNRIPRQVLEDEIRAQWIGSGAVEG